MIRKLSGLAFCALISAWLLCGPTPGEAQGKKDELAKLNQQLKKALQERDQQIAKLRLDYDSYRKKNPSAPKLQKDLDKANQMLKDKDAQIATLQQGSPQAIKDLTKENAALRQRLRDADAVKKAPFVHSMILKLKTEDADQAKTVYDEANKTLAKIGGVRGVWVGKPAENGTPELAQSGYQIGVVVLLDDSDALQKFLDDPLHKQFTDKMGENWERPVVYDFQRDADKPKKDEPKKDEK